MKRLLLPFSLFFFFVYQAHAQIQVGPKFGVNWNSFTGNKAFDVVPGVNVGVFGKYDVLSFLTAKGEILFSQQGANLIDYSVIPYELYHNNAQVIFNTVQVPLIAEFGLPSLMDEPLRPKLSLGAFYGYNFYARERFTNVAKVRGYESVEYEGHENVTSQYEPHQFGLIGGIGADLEIFNTPVFLEFRYHHNLTRITKPGMTQRYNLKETFEEWGSDKLYLGTLSFNIAVTLQSF